MSTTHRLHDEPELTASVVLCGADGHLNRQAVGWSRHPLHTCNLPPSLSRKKKWNYWAVTSNDLLFSATIADIDRLQLAGAYVFDRQTHRHIEKIVIQPASTIAAVIREHAGTPIEGKLLGDGVLAVFTSARQAIEAALACGRSGDGAGLPLHLGLHAGDVIREDNNVYGGAVNIASRISGLSAPGEVLVSDTVRSLARTSAGVAFEDRGEQELKGVGEPVRVWAVRTLP